jgi:alcohol dehydrogenase
MRPSGELLHEIGSLIDSGVVRPVVDRVFTFDLTKEVAAGTGVEAVCGRYQP